MHAALKDRDLSDYGVVMSGQMGDFSMGYFLVKPGHEITEVADFRENGFD